MIRRAGEGIESFIRKVPPCEFDEYILEAGMAGGEAGELAAEALEAVQ